MRLYLIAGLGILAWSAGFLGSYFYFAAPRAAVRTAKQDDFEPETTAAAQMSAGPVKAQEHQLAIPEELPADTEMLLAEAESVARALLGDYPSDPAAAEMNDQLAALARDQHKDLATVQKKIAALYTNAGRVCLTHGDAADAEQLWKRAAALHREDRNCRQALAWYYLQQRKPQDTIRLLEELARLEPANASYAFEIARLYLTLNRGDAAERTLRILCTTLPEEPLAHATLAELYLRSNQKPAEAVTHSRRAVELAPTAANYMLLAAAQELRGDVASALQALRQAIDKDPTNLQYREMLEALQKKAEGQQQPTVPAGR